jgi:RNA polymerase sigma-70 factor (ECF subfamily)
VVDHSEEPDLVRRAKAGDRRAFDVLVDLYWDRIHRWLSDNLGRGRPTEDLAQDTFVKAWIALPHLQREEHFRSWLYKIARNLALDHIKGPRGVIPDQLPALLPGRDGEPDRPLLEREAEQQLHSALERLSPTNRMAYLLWTHEKLPYSEIGQILGVSEETARWRVCTARKALVNELASYLDRTPK